MLAGQQLQLHCTAAAQLTLAVVHPAVQNTCCRNDELQVAAYLAQLQQQQHQQHCSAQAGLLLSLALPADATQQCATSSAGSSKACAVLASHGV